MIDEQGYRENVGIVIINDKQQVLLAKNISKNHWQFPQGGVEANETLLETLFRELFEEVGLDKKKVDVIAKTSKWLHYKLPNKLINSNKKPLFIGQKQIWFLLKLLVDDKNIKLDCCKEVEFDAWEWVEYWHPIEKIVNFKRQVYIDMLNAFAFTVFNDKRTIPKKYFIKSQCSVVVL